MNDAQCSYFESIMTHNNIGSYKMQTTKAMYISSALLQSAQQVNGNARSNKVDNLDNRLWHSSDGRTKCFNREYRDENKATFSERLKVLLENGSISEKIDDPYAFQDVEQTPDVLSSTFNHLGTLKRCNSAQTTLLAAPTVGTPAGAQTGVSDDAFRNKLTTTIVATTTTNTSSNNTSLKNTSAVSVPVYNMASNPNNAALTCRVNVNQTQHSTEAAKVQNCLLISPQLCAPTKIGLVAKPILNSKPSAASAQCKPQNFGKSQMSKLAIAKIGKTLENRNKPTAKGLAATTTTTTSTSVSVNKTATISKFLPKPKKSAPMRSTSLDSELVGKVEMKNKSKLISGRCLLEETLLGTNPVFWNNSTASENALNSVNRNPRHESLERIWNLRNKFRQLKSKKEELGLLLDSERNDGQETTTTAIEADNFIFQKYWFSLCTEYDSFAGHNRKREAKLAHIKTELRHKLKQQQWRLRDNCRDEMVQLIIKTARRLPNLTAFLIGIDNDSNRSYKSDRITPKNECIYYTDHISQTCRQRALPNAPYCPQHIHLHASQHLFGSCTAPMQPESGPCTAPAMGKGQSSILCVDHQRLQPMTQQKPVADKIAGKRSRSSIGSSRSGRSRKRKRQLKDRKDPRDHIQDAGYRAFNPSENTSNTLSSNVYIGSRSDIDETQDIEVGEEALAIASAELPLDPVELATLATQASRLLEEQDLSTVFTQINDLFTDGREKYEPTPQETEELERALAAVDHDVKSLEKLSEQGLLDMLDEQSIAQTLAALPDVVPVLYQNGFAGIGNLEPAMCDSLPNSLIISSHTDILQS